MRTVQEKIAFQFILLMGVVSLLGDITYEGVRSIAGPFLSELGAGAAVVGLVAGVGEFAGYALRLASGYFSDRTKAYWPVTMVGYGLLLSIPLLAFTDHWEAAAILIILERIGKGVRTPARDAILSHATKQVGRGLGFGIHEALDQIGAIIGPLIFSAVFFVKGGYRQGFGILWIPALLCLATLLAAWIRVPSPVALETDEAVEKKGAKGKAGFPLTFWHYSLFVFFSVAGFASFQIISYHFQVQKVVSGSQIPLFYAVAMGVDALVAPIIGRTYDKVGLASLIAIPLLTIPIPFLAFSQSPHLALMSVILWGAVMGIHETIMRAAIADLTTIERRGSAYGIFNTIYGGAWFLGCTAQGALYDISIPFLIVFVTAAQAISLPFFFLLKART